MSKHLFSFEIVVSKILVNRIKELGSLSLVSKYILLLGFKHTWRSPDHSNFFIVIYRLVGDDEVA